MIGLLQLWAWLRSAPTPSLAPAFKRQDSRTCAHAIGEKWDCGCSFRCMPGMPCEASWRCLVCLMLFREAPSQARTLTYDDPEAREWRHRHFGKWGY